MYEKPVLEWEQSPGIAKFNATVEQVKGYLHICEQLETLPESVLCNKSKIYYGIVYNPDTFRLEEWGENLYNEDEEPADKPETTKEE